MTYRLQTMSTGLASALMLMATSPGWSEPLLAESGSLTLLQTMANGLQTPAIPGKINKNECDALRLTADDSLGSLF